jgi:hypothetical protein
MLKLHRKFNFVVSLLTSFVALTACGMSPAMNHVYPNRSAQAIHTEVIHSQTGEACDFYFKTQDLCAALIWNHESNRDSEGDFTLQFWNRTQGENGPASFVDPVAAVVAVKLWMPEMGHGSQKVKVEHLGMGVFKASEVMFVMPGTWEINLQLKDSAQQILDTAKISYLAQ